jgi:hypothetical protein
MRKHQASETNDGLIQRNRNPRPIPAYFRIRIQALLLDLQGLRKRNIIKIILRKEEK